MCNLHRGPSIDAAYQVSVHLAKRFLFENRPVKNKNCLWWPCLLTYQDEMCNLHRGPFIDASYQVSVQLAEWFQMRRLKCEKLTDNGRRMLSDGKSSHCLWQGELTTVCGQTCHSNLTHNPNYEPTSLCSYSIILHAQQRSNTYKFHSLWFEMTGA